MSNKLRVFDDRANECQYVAWIAASQCGDTVYCWIYCISACRSLAWYIHSWLNCNLSIRWKVKHSSLSSPNQFVPLSLSLSRISSFSIHSPEIYLFDSMIISANCTLLTDNMKYFWRIASWIINGFIVERCINVYYVTNFPPPPPIM